MKNLIIFAFLLISIPVLSQDNHFGFKGAYVTSSINHPKSSDNDSYSKRNMFSAGAFYNIGLSKHFSFQIEALYTLKGYKRTIISERPGKPTQTVIYPYNSDYIELPLLIKYSFGETIKPYINTGIAPSFNVSDPYNAYKPFDLGIIASIGLDIPLSKKISTFIELRTSLGLLNTHKPLSSDSFYKNNSLYASTGLIF